MIFLFYGDTVNVKLGLKKSSESNSVRNILGIAKLRSQISHCTSAGTIHRNKKTHT